MGLSPIAIVRHLSHLTFQTKCQLRTGKKKQKDFSRWQVYSSPYLSYKQSTRAQLWFPNDYWEQRSSVLRVVTEHLFFLSYNDQHWVVTGNQWLAQDIFWLAQFQLVYWELLQRIRESQKDLLTCLNNLSKLLSVSDGLCYHLTAEMGDLGGSSSVLTRWHKGLHFYTCLILVRLIGYLSSSEPRFQPCWVLPSI